MVELNEIPYSAMEWFIYIAFSDDKQLLSKYHKRDKTTKECIENLILQIGVMRENYKIDCYGVFLDGEPIGFSIVGAKFLFSFGIDIHFRTKDILIEWFGLIKEKLENEFVTWLYNENKRAIRFFEKNGMDIVDENEVYKTLAYVN